MLNIGSVDDQGGEWVVQRIPLRNLVMARLVGAPTGPPSHRPEDVLNAPPLRRKEPTVKETSASLIWPSRQPLSRMWLRWGQEHKVQALRIRGCAASVETLSVALP